MTHHDSQGGVASGRSALSRRDFVAKSASALAVLPIAASPWATLATAESPTPDYRSEEKAKMTLSVDECS